MPDLRMEYAALGYQGKSLLKSKVDGPDAPLDLIPLAPDIEPPPAT